MADSNIQWMYDGANSKIDRESFLLGKRITKAPEDKGDFIVEDTTTGGGVSVLERLDYESKLREDPLVAIQKREQEKRRELLSNPVKRRKLQSTLKNALLRDLKKSEDSDSDDVGRMLKNKDRKFQESLRKALEEDLSSSSEEEARRKRKKSKKKKKRRNSTSGSEEDCRRRNSDRKDDKFDSERKSHIPNQSDKSRSKKERRRSSSGEARAPPVEKTDKAPRKEGYGLIMLKHKEKVEKTSAKRKVPEKVEKYRRREKQGFTRKLTAEDLERKRREMMQNATTRDEQRRSNVEHYKNEDKLLEEREDKVKKIHEEQRRRDGKAKTFIHDLKLKRADGGSLEDTVRRNRHSLRKGHGD